MKKTDDTFSYFIEIADYVRKKRISPMLLSSTEGQILIDWERKGIPVDVVKSSIDMAYEKFLKTKKTSRKIFSLKNCKSLVLNVARFIDGWCLMVLSQIFSLLSSLANSYFSRMLGVLLRQI